MGKITASRKQLKGDSRYGNLVVSKFINYLMLDGKKTAAEKIFYDALDILEGKLTDVTPLEAFLKALDNVKPQVEVRSKRVGGSSYQVPMPVKANRGQALCIRWILAAVRDKKGQPTAQKLAAELFDAYNMQGTAFTKRENVHKMAEANKAFAHFA